MAILRLLILSLVLSLTLPMAVFATSNPIPGVDIIVKKNPGGQIMHLTTDKTGALDLSKLPKGRYSFEVADTSRLPKAFVMTFTIPGTAPLVSVSIFDRWGKQSSPVSPVAVGNSRSQTDHDTGESGGAGGL
ncbi:MAG: carboxypeptidase-like regulatory domain-containing protein [Proteobacteria bacterium]|nr:carboxypeptidase-like regulatory domain-containing protein [Pseudomonadota bacterium]MDA1286276.1 carboxypeptidase-like regulatory domain-containing protein [Pseudomonadota bacterium]